MMVKTIAAIATIVTLVVTLLGCDTEKVTVPERCPSTTVTNSCFYCCFNEIGYPGSVFGCFSGDNITEASCRDFLLEDKNCDQPLHVDFQEECLCEDDCVVPDWFE